jgi:hypothetical protein
VLQECPVYADDVCAQEYDGDDGENSLTSAHANLPSFQFFTADVGEVTVQRTYA